MMASLRAKAGGGGKRSGNGRECRLLGGQGYLPRDGRNGIIKAPARAPARTGHGAQAAAWNASLKFERSPKAAANTSSNSTSPETDPGTSDVFPFFKEDRGEDAEASGDEDQEAGAIRVGGAGGGGVAGAGAGTAAAGIAVGQRKSSEKKSLMAPKLDYRNPMYHAANANVEKDVARPRRAKGTISTILRLFGAHGWQLRIHQNTSLFPAEKSEESTRAAMNGSNPMFNRSISLDAAARARPGVKADHGAKGGSSKSLGAAAAAAAASGTGVGERAANGTQDHKEDHPKKKKKEKAMYEHVGRMNMRPFRGDSVDEKDAGSQHQSGFRVDTFARNEGEAGGKAHFKFVFTVDGEPPASEAPKGSRPVLDAVHERSTGNLRVRVNDGREIGATRSAAVEIALSNIGVVLFNPKSMAKGHHLYTLSLHGRTLFSVLA